MHHVFPFFVKDKGCWNEKILYALFFLYLEAYNRNSNKIKLFLKTFTNTNIKHYLLFSTCIVIVNCDY